MSINIECLRKTVLLYHTSVYFHVNQSDIQKDFGPKWIIFSFTISYNIFSKCNPNMESAQDNAILYSKVLSSSTVLLINANTDFVLFLLKILGSQKYIIWKLPRIGNRAQMKKSGASSKCSMYITACWQSKWMWMCEIHISVYNSVSTDNFAITGQWMPVSCWTASISFHWTASINRKKWRIYQNWIENMIWSMREWVSVHSNGQNDQKPRTHRSTTCMHLLVCLFLFVLHSMCTSCSSSYWI